MIMNYESGGMWKVVVKGYFKAVLKFDWRSWRVPKRTPQW